MATTRKRSTSSSGFASKEAEANTETPVEEFLEEANAEMFETISRIEEEVKAEEPKVEAVAPRQVITYVPEEITPTDDVGARFVDPAPAPTPKPKAEAPALKAPPKRHPRNVPRFSAHK